MCTRPIVVFVSAFLLFTSLCLGQVPTATVDPEKEKAKKEQDERIVQILDQVVSEAALLRLPQNRAVVLIMAGDLYWKFDEKRARDLFRSGASEIVAHNADVERERRDATETMMGFFDGSDQRNQLLPLIAAHDAEFALELLIQTRPAAVAEAMLRAGTPDRSSSGMFNFNPDDQRVRGELEMEQRFAVLAADSNPDRAIKMIRDSLSRGVSYNVLQLLQKLHRKDEKKAAELAGEVVRKLVETDLSRRNDIMNVAINFLQVMSRGAGTAMPNADAKAKAFSFTDAQSKDLANKMVATFLQPINSANLSMLLSRAMPSLEKIVPDKIAALKQRQAESQKSLPTELRGMQRMERMFDPNSTPEQILAEIPKMQNELERSNAYQAAGRKIGQIEDETRAKKLIEQIGDEKARASIQEQYESAKVSRTAASGKLDEARRMIGTLTDKRTQVQKLVALALQFHKKGGETDREAAADLMKSARSLINESPEDEDELNSLMEVVRGYATVEPDAAFRLFEPIVDQINDIIHASAILSKYNKRSRSFKKGEMVLRPNSGAGSDMLLFRYLGQIQLLGKADLIRMGSLADRFQRGDARSFIKLVALQGVARDDKRANEQPVAPDFIY